MAEATLRGSAALAPIAVRWRRLSPRLVPVFAVLTALVISTIFMILTTLITTGRVDIGKELNTTGTAYSALIEGSLGLVINQVLTPDKLALAQSFLKQGDLQPRGLNGAAASANDLSALGFDKALVYATIFERFPDLTDEQVDDLGGRIAALAALGDAKLDAIKPLMDGLVAAGRNEATALIDEIAARDQLTPAAKARLVAAVPAAANIGDADLLDYLKTIQAQGTFVRAQRTFEAYGLLAAQKVSVTSPEARDLAAIAELKSEKARTIASFAKQVRTAAITEPGALTEQLRFIQTLYDEKLLTNASVSAALETELTPMLAQTLVIMRPNAQVEIDRSNSAAGILYIEARKPDGTTERQVDTVFLRVGSRALLFFPARLEGMIVRSIPFVIAGLALALSFKAGLFNIGAEGQLYAGGVLAVWVGFSPIFAGLPPLLHIPLVIIMGLLGGLLWGAIPGVLKAFAGAHEVINTIMLNFIAILLTDWLIKSTEPVILLDTSASLPTTPPLASGARLPTFNTISPIWYVIAGVIVLAIGIYRQRQAIGQNPRLLIRPVVNGVLVAVLGLFFGWLSVRGKLHIGLLIMIFMVWFTEWFLERTIPGFELRTVGANPDAARYAGMNVRLNTVLALALSGAIAGLAGAIEISGVQFSMQPGFFAGLGFDAIAVALLARSNPRNMMAAGFLWGALLAGAGLMQTRAEISVDLVKIIQALIIMFVAADIIIRYLWRVPEATPEEKAAALFSAKGWG
jgi:simple sugar transport system permease protein